MKLPLIKKVNDYWEEGKGWKWNALQKLLPKVCPSKNSTDPSKSEYGDK